ncbi:MAG: hypothetical protein P4L51_23920 [Puia sp.]|nr:hypothetical protein [Puia sp.]
MSDISSLSNQYDQLVLTSEKVNDSVVVFKKDNLLRDAATKRKYPNLNISAKDVEEASAILLLFIADIFDQTKSGLEEKEVFMPVEVKDDYKEKLRKEAAYVDEDLKRLHHTLQEQKPVTENDLKLMDMLVTTLDTERNSLFRKLRMARG